MLNKNGFLFNFLLLISISRTSQLNSSLHENNISSDQCKVYCNPKILNIIDMSGIFNDSSHFVRMKLREPPERVEARFIDFLNLTKNNPNKTMVERFVIENFEESNEFIPWVPPDWKAQPKFIQDVYDMPLKNWVRLVVARWKALGRKLSEDVKLNNTLYSQIYLPNPYIIPGGKFTELYYWDSYWIIEGLLISEMRETARGMIDNFLYLVKKFGYIPNGTRKYYLGRSQPPLLVSMIKVYFSYTKDIGFIREAIGTLENEFNFWVNNRSTSVAIDGKKYRVFIYNVTSDAHRPESYVHDEMLVKGQNASERLRILSGLRSAAESGWDFSSRWFLDSGDRSDNISFINTNAIAPVCLNSFMGMNARLISDFYDLLGNKSKSLEYKLLAMEINTTISRVFWSERDGIWLDYDLISNELLPGFYVSNLIPLWTETYGVERSPTFIVEQAIAYLDRNNITSYPGGIPTSTCNSSQQWDLPFGWAPLQYFMVLGLQKAGRHHSRAHTLAFDFAQKWVLNVYQTYLNLDPNEMLEKYDVTEIGSIAQGGEYLTQFGFGWTNGVVIKFLLMYGHKIKTRNITDIVPMTVGLILFSVALVSVICYMYRTKVFHKLKWGDDSEEERIYFVP